MTYPGYRTELGPAAIAPPPTSRSRMSDTFVLDPEPLKRAKRAYQ
jgi:hypothetical protein